MAFQKTQPAYVGLKTILAEKTTPIVAWVGAGLSAPAGLPSWKGLLEGLIEAAKEKVQSLAGAGVAMQKGMLQTIQEKEKAKEYWLCFQLLEQLLGAATYQSEIRQRLGKGSSAQVPVSYELLWKLSIGGLVTLNLDPLANRAFSKSFPGKDIERFAGFQAKNLMGVIQRNKLFVASVHGTLEDSSSWVFTTSKLKALLSDPGYKQFINTCLTARVVLFVGITADDVAVSEHLQILSSSKISGVQHFWITDRNDAATDQWAESLNVSIIRYRSVDNDHSELEECLRDLAATGASKEESFDPIAFSGIESEPELLPPDQLVAQPLEIMRRQLNARANKILRSQDDKAYADYERFCQEYDEVIDRAWYVTVQPPKNVLLGYTLESMVASGSFGVVYNALSPKGDRVAVKVLRRDVRMDPSMLQTFRRGVRSMKILRRHAVPGMVEFVDASEIPALVVMEWIDGPDLSTLVKARQIQDWLSIIKIASELAKIIYRAHQLPERVLHRDIRPPNVMLRNFWNQSDDYEVVVTDFDLSWHVESLELSVVAKPLGFMAPEQLHRRDGKGGVSTRSALVDSFGFGMTLYYMLTSEIPVPDQQKHKDWDEILRSRIARKAYSGWKSLPMRVARMVHGATKDEQSERWDFSRIVGELEVLRRIVNDDYSRLTVDYLAEEIAAHSESIPQYHWDDDKGSAVYENMGNKIQLHGNLPSGTVQLTMEWQQTGAENWKARFKSTQEVKDKIDGILERGGWRSVKNDGSIGFTRITANLEPSYVEGEAKRLAKAVDAIAHVLRPKS